MVARDGVHRRQVHRRQREPDPEAHDRGRDPEVRRKSVERSTVEIQAIATSIIVRPMTIGGRGPTRAANLPPSGEATTISPVSGSSRTPVSVGDVAEDVLEVGGQEEQQRAEREVDDEDRRRRAGEVAALEEVEVDERVARCGARRRRTRRSATTPPTSRPMIAAEPQPQVAPWISARVIAVSPVAVSSAPGMSIRRGARRVARLGGAAQRQERRSAARRRC